MDAFQEGFRHSWADGCDFVNFFFFQSWLLMQCTLPALPHIRSTLIHSFSVLIGDQFSLFFTVASNVMQKVLKAPWVI